MSISADKRRELETGTNKDMYHRSMCDCLGAKVAVRLSRCHLLRVSLGIRPRMAATGPVSPLWPSPVGHHEPFRSAAANTARDELDASTTRKDVDLCGGGGDSKEDEFELDHTFAGHTRNLLVGEVLAEDAVESWRQACLREGDELRYMGVGMQSSVKSMEDIFQSADFLKSEAITWSLVKRVVCGDKKLDLGDIRPSGGLTFRQKAASLINANADLLRCAHLIMWLEEIAATNDDHENSQPEPLTMHDGLWSETINQSKFMQGVSAELITEFDLDASNRQDRKISAGDHKAQQRMFKSVWKSIRTGNTQEATKKCHEAGQPLVAAMLVGGGLTGPIPLHLENEPRGNLQNELFLEDCGNDNAIMLRLGCYNIAQAAKKGFQGQGVNYEAAVYGSLCGDVESMLPACETWEDIVWAHAKSYIQITAEKRVLDMESDDPSARNNGLLYQDENQFHRLLSELGLMATKTVLMRKWPLDSLIGIQPTSTSEIFLLAMSKCIPSILEMTKLPFSVAQQLLVKGDLDALLNTVLWPWVIDSVKATKEMECSAADVIASFSVIRFSAHFALLLKILDTDNILEGASRVMESMLQAYVFTILNKGLYKLIPMYSLYIDPMYRDKLLHRTLSEMANVPDDVKRDWVKDASYWIDRKDSIGPMVTESTSSNPLSLLDTILHHSADCQKNPSFSPETRVEAARWIFFCCPDSPLARPKHAEVCMLVNVFRDFVVSGRMCTDQGARLAECMPAWQYCYAGPDQRCDAEDQLVLVGLQKELNRLINFFKVEHAIQKWVSIVNRIVRVNHGVALYQKESTAPEKLSSIEDIGVKAELDVLEKEGLDLFDAAIDNMLNGGWICCDSRELVTGQSGVEVILRFCESGDTESAEYTLFSDDRMATMDAVLGAWSTQLFASLGVELHIDLQDGFVMLQASASSQNIMGLVRELVALCKGEIVEIGTVGVFSLTGSSLDALQLICQRVALGRLIAHTAKVQELLWLLGSGLHTKPPLVETVTSNSFLIDSLGYSEAFAVSRSEEKGHLNQLLGVSRH